MIAEKEWEEAKRAGIQILTPASENYPKKLLDLPKPPAFLWAKGNLSLLDNTLGIVGTRNATLYGREIARSWGKGAAELGVAVVSGLARGIDTAAHEGALTGGKTVAILGSGLKSIYPQENKPLAEKIGAEGLLLSEYPLHTPPQPYQFPARNRLIAALSTQLLIIEAPIKSGALLTANEALSLKRPLFAVPGRVDWPSFLGSHLLIKEGKAKIATALEDLVAGVSKKLSFSSKDEPLLALFGETEKDVETLLALSGLPLPHLNAELMRLLLQGKIAEFPGRLYKRLGI